jgi:hypothetical protein
MIIGLLGFIGSGKGTVADILVSKGFKKESFADPVKDAVSAIFGWDRALLEGDTKESRDFREAKDEWWSQKTAMHITPRAMLQIMGTEAGRDTFHPDLWILSLEQRLKKNKHTVIADVRFPNECESIRKMGGFIVQVSRGSNPEWYDVARRANLEKNTDLMVDYPIHYSEWAWIGQQTDYVISNNGSLDMLNADVKHLLKIFVGTDIMKSNEWK